MVSSCNLLFGHELLLTFAQRLYKRIKTKGHLFRQKLFTVLQNIQVNIMAASIMVLMLFGNVIVTL